MKQCKTYFLCVDFLIKLLESIFFLCSQNFLGEGDFNLLVWLSLSLFCGTNAPAFPLFFVLLLQAVLKKVNLLLFEVLELGRVISGREWASSTSLHLLLWSCFLSEAWSVSSFLPGPWGIRGNGNYCQSPHDRQHEIDANKSMNQCPVY